MLLFGGLGQFNHPAKVRAEKGEKEMEKTFDEKLFHIGSAARFLECSTETVRRLTRSGKLPYKRDYQNRRVFALTDLLALKAERGALR